jgi:hypothetical protein
MIEVNDNFKKYGFDKTQVDKIGIKGVSELMTKYSNRDTGVPTDEIKKVESGEIIKSKIKGYSKPRIVYGTTKNLAKKEIKEFISYLKKDDRFKPYIK